MNRLTAKEVTCPLCDAPPGAPCMSVRKRAGELGKKLRNPHTRRHDEAVRINPGPFLLPKSRVLGHPRTRLKGKEFGALKIVCLWGSQSGNLAWVYWCRACGHVGKRQGGKLNRGEYRCPACGATRKPPRVHARKPLNQDLLAAFMESAPPPPPEARRKPLTISRSLESATHHELNWLLDLAETEIARRVETRKRR